MQTKTAQFEDNRKVPIMQVSDEDAALLDQELSSLGPQIVGIMLQHTDWSDKGNPTLDLVAVREAAQKIRDSQAS